MNNFEMLNFASYFIFPLLMVFSVLMMHRTLKAENIPVINMFKIIPMYLKTCQDKQLFPVWFLQFTVQIPMAWIYLMKTVLSTGLFIFTGAYLLFSLICFVLYRKKKDLSERLFRVKTGGNITSCPYCGSEKATSYDKVCLSCRKELG